MAFTSGTGQLFQLMGPNGLRERRKFKSPRYEDQKAYAKTQAERKQKEQENE
jgi:hypothetical protein